MGVMNHFMGFIWFIRTNVLISMDQQVRTGFLVLELEITTPGCWAMGVECCHQGGDRPALAWSHCKPGGLAAPKGRNENISPSPCLKEQEHPSILRSWKASNTALPGWVALVTDTEEDHSSNFHWEGFRSDDRP